jgi:hypothetical protein
VGEGSFDAVALFVEGFVEAALHDTVAAWWDDDFGSAPAQVLEDGFGVIASICDQCFRPAIG